MCTQQIIAAISIGSFDCSFPKYTKREVYSTNTVLYPAGARKRRMLLYQENISKLYLIGYRCLIIYETQLLLII